MELTRIAATAAFWKPVAYGEDRRCIGDDRESVGRFVEAVGDQWFKLDADPREAVAANDGSDKPCHIEGTANGLPARRSASTARLELETARTT